GRSEDQIEQHNYHILAWICLTSLAFILVFFFLYYKWKVKRNKKHDEENEVLLPISQESLIQDYKKHLTSSSRPQYDSVLQRQLLVIEPGFLGSCKIMKTSIGNNSEEINAEELFTLENQHLLSRRMLLVGDAGSGKSYFCKWLQHKWIQKDINIYNCILYLSCKNIKNEMSLKKICDTIFEQISTVLSMDKILLIFDELDDLLCQKENVNLTEKIDTDTPLDIKTLLKLIMGKQLVPDTDVLIASRSDSWIFSNNKFDSTFYLLDFTEEETKNLYNTITAKDKKADNRSKRISDITYTPAFVVLMSYLQTAKELENNRDCSPYKILIDVLLMWTTDVTGKRRDLKNNFTNMAKKAYENLTKGEPYSSESMEYWEEFLKLYNCEHKYIYQCNMLRDMLAAMHCVWETHRIGGLTECLDFWVFGNIIYSNNNELLKSIADEHNAKYYHFIRFFLRLLTYPDCDSLCNNKPVKNRDTQELLSGWFKKSFNIHSKHSERLKIIHCIFELNNEKVTREFWSIIKKIELFNTPLNFKDIQAIEYCLRGIVLEELDLRICALEDKSVSLLRSVIKNTKYVLLSSNNLTAETGKLLGEILRDPDCMIEKLSLGTNKLGACGAQDLWRALEHNKNLIGLYVYDNNIQDEGTRGIVEYLRNNNSLKELQYALLLWFHFTFIFIFTFLQFFSRF
ncbi:hypothetical protein GDO81_009947, partial [Engystomops pustulosus]